MAHLTRTLLLLIVLLGVLTGVLWGVFPGVIKSLDENAVALWMHRSKKDLGRAQELRREGELAESEAVLANLVDSMGDVQIRDRLDKSWRRAMQARIEMLVELERVDEAIDCAREYREHAPRDLPNSLQLGNLLLGTEAGVEEGLQILSDLQAMVPEWSPAADAFARALHGQGQSDDAIEVGLDYLRSARHLQPLDWKGFWADDSPFAESRSFTFDLEQAGEPGYFSMSFAIPAAEGQLNKLRLVTHLWACSRMTEWELTVTTPDQEVVIRDPEQLAKNAQIRATQGGALETIWASRSSLTVELAEPLQLSGGARIDLSLRLDPMLPPGVRPLFEDPNKFLEVESRLAQQGREVDAVLLRRALNL